MTSVKKIIAELRGEFASLIEAGLVAVNQGDEDSAIKLFSAAQVLEPDSTAPRVGFGFISLNKLEIEKAINLFQVVVDQEPEHHLARAFLGISLAFDPKTRLKGEKLISDANKKTEDDSLKHLCHVSSEWIEKDLKKKSEGFF